MTGLTPLESADLLLAGIALPLLVAFAAVLVTSIGVALAFGAASLPASGTLGYALFFSPPDPMAT